jgi:nucleotide sugar dehydrogenase
MPPHVRRFRRAGPRGVRRPQRVRRDMVSFGIKWQHPFVISGPDSKTVVVGLGYVGLPLAVELVAAGYQVVGLDRDESVVSGLLAGRSHVDDVSDAAVLEALGRRFRPTSESSCISDADVVVVCVPTPLSQDRAPDLAAVEDVGRMLGRRLRAGTLVVLESTTYPGHDRGLLPAAHRGMRDPDRSGIEPRILSGTY